MKSFYNFFEQAEDNASLEPKRVSDDAVTVFGRHQPPHLGHKLTFDRAQEIASNVGDKAPGDQMFYTSRSMDPKKNPLPFQLKTKFLQKMFPEHAQKWDSDENVRTILGAATKAYDKGYKNFHFVGGGDRQQPMEDLLRRYNGNLYNFDNIYSHSAGMRDEEGAGDDIIAKLSASKLRGMAGKGDFEGFLGGMPQHDKFTEDDIKDLFDAIQMYSQKNEDWEVDHRTHREYIRELYINEDFFQPGDVVESLTTGLIGQVHRCGANHVICITEDGIMFKNFIHDIHHLNN
jgi:hypothetical protein